MFRGMEYVYAVYKEKSFSKAAEKLFISQPSLSANVKREEKAIGYPIFDRSTKPLVLTEPRKKYIETVEHILSMQSEFSEYIDDLGELKIGKLIIGGSSLYSSWVLPALMGKFSKQYPHVRLELVEETTVNLQRMLQNGDVDLVLDNCELDEQIFEKQIYRKEYLILAVPRHMKINQKLREYQIHIEDIRNLSFLGDGFKAVNLKSFENEPFILLKPENDTRIRAMKLCEQHQFLPKMVFELDQQMTSYNITCSGMGISFISNTLIAKVPESKDVVYYKIDGAESRRNLYFYRKRNSYLSKAMKAFLDLTNDGV